MSSTTEYASREQDAGWVVHHYLAVLWRKLWILTPPNSGQLWRSDFKLDLELQGQLETPMSPKGAIKRKVYHSSEAQVSTDVVR